MGYSAPARMPFRSLTAAVAAAAIVGIGAWPACRPPAEAPVDPAARNRAQLWRELQPVALERCEMARFGEGNDGGYLVCGNLLSDVRAGFSYGISGYDGWGCEVATRFHVPVHEYDCFDQRAPACGGGATTFHGECIGREAATIDGRPFDTLEHQVAAAGHAGDRIVMKIDVEGAEWDVFLTVPDDVLERVDQLVVEFHQTSAPRFLSAVQRLKRYFHVTNLHMNNNACSGEDAPFGAWAYEVLFVNKRLPVGTVSPRETPYHALDRPNATDRPDCQVATSR